MLPQTYEVEIEQHRQIQGITAKKWWSLIPIHFGNFIAFQNCNTIFTASQ